MALNDEYTLSPLVVSMKQMADLLQAEQSELDLFENAIEHEKNQLFICSCDTQLPRYEKLFGLNLGTSLSIPEQRIKIITKQNSRASATIKTIKDIASLITGNQCEIIEYFNQYKFTIQISLAKPNTVEELAKVQRQIDDIKPAHLISQILVVSAFESAVFIGAVLTSYKQEVISNV